MLDPSQVPNPIAGAATPSSDPLSGTTADKFSGAAQTVQPSQQQTAPAAPAPPAQPAPDKHALLGRLVSHIKNAVEGRETVYTADSNTGAVVESTQPRKPGGIFRDVVSGMLSGLAASSMATDHPSGAAGLALGFQGAQQNRQAMQDRARAQAQQSATSGFQRKQQLDAQTLQAATVAHDNMSTLALGHFAPHFSDTELGQYNDSVSAVRNVLMENGAQLADVQGNDEKGNGPGLMSAYNRDNSLMVAPEGYHRVQSTTFDTTGLKHEGHQWVNEDGSQLSPDEWNKRATVSLIDVPNAAWGKSVSLPGSVIQDVAPNSNLVRDPKKTYNTSIGSVFALGLKNKQQMLDARNELYRGPKNDDEAKSWQAQYEGYKQRKAEGDTTPDEDRQWAIRGPMVDSYDFKQKAPTKTQVDLETNRMETALDQGAIADKDRNELIQRERKDPNYMKGVSADIRAAIGGDRPVPAEFLLGRKDPAYIKLDKMWGDASLNEKKALAMAPAIARMKEMGKIRYYNVIDTETGQMTAANADDLNKLVSAKPGKIILATQDGTKMMAKDASIDDIQTNINYTRDSIQGLDDMDASTRMKLALALRETDPTSGISTFLQSEAGKALGDKQQTAVIALRSMAENVMVMRAVQGVSGAGSDMVRQAMLDIIPSGKTPSKGYADKQFNILQRTLDQVKKGIPTAGVTPRVKPKTNVDENANPVKPPAPQTHAFSLSAWQRSHPGGDVNAAKAAAQAQGFKVTN